MTLTIEEQRKDQEVMDKIAKAEIERKQQERLSNDIEERMLQKDVLENSRKAEMDKLVQDSKIQLPLRNLLRTDVKQLKTQLTLDNLMSPKQPILREPETRLFPFGTQVPSNPNLQLNGNGQLNSMQREDIKKIEVKRF